MSSQRPNRSRGGDKDEASAKNAPSKGESKTPMGRFKSLTRSILTVSNSQVKDEQSRLEKAKTKPPND
jgi:hypothetical protein